MKVCSIILVFLFVVLSSSILTAGETGYFQQGRLMESLVFDSKILDWDVKYSIYLPPDYDSSSRRYPVVYLLHGATDDDTGWIQFGEVHLAADRAIAAREIPPMIIVMPDAKMTWYINDYQGEDRYEDMLITEFIPYIDKTYRTRTKKRYRGISGLSMGGYGALITAMRHPDLFTACAAFSSGTWTDEEIIKMEEKRYERYYSKLYGHNLKGEARLTEHYKKYSPLHQGKSLPEETLKRVRWYLDCGDDDFLYRGNSALHVLLRERNIPHEYRVRDGGHSWIYWRTGITAGLKFIGEDFN
ncbi:MAG: alpha/beta hydrolase [Planctomycetota bacterium]|jgi:enterochelin esterase-like enzyme